MFLVKRLASVITFAAAALLAQADRFGLPRCNADGSELRDHAFFLVCQNTELRVPLWTAYELLPEHLGAVAARPTYFRQDIAHNSDYRASGFARGHMVPARDMAWSEESIRATFVLSNVVPQDPRVNSGIWRALEEKIRAIAAQSDAVYVFTGPIFASAEIRSIGDGVAIPTHLFKVLLAVRGNEKTMFAAIVPNTAGGVKDLGSFGTSVDAVERATGLDFFAGLGDEEEDRLESCVLTLE